MTLKSAALLILTIFAGLQIYIRLAVADPAEWHIDLVKARPAGLVPNPSAGITRLEGGAFLDLASSDPMQALQTIARAAEATPRTRILAGSVAGGHVTWETRSLLWGFPDYTTAQITPEGLALYARLRFGQGDLGVNAARLQSWTRGL